MANKFNLYDSITIADTRGKFIFWDIDGTLAPYRFNGHVGDPNGTNNGQSIEEIEVGIFLERNPSKHMQKVLIKKWRNFMNTMIISDFAGCEKTYLYNEQHWSYSSTKK